MKYLLFIFLLLCSLTAISQRTPLPTANPQVNNFNYNRFNGYVGIEYGLMLRIRDTNWTPTNSFMALIINTTDSLPYWWNGRKWQSIAAPLGSFVKYSDSTVVFVTPTQLHDSLTGYVTLNTPQTLGSSGAKTFTAVQTFNDDIVSNDIITNSIKADVRNTFTKSDSLKNIKDQIASNYWRNRITNNNYLKNKTSYPTSVGIFNNSFLIQKTSDTLSPLAGGTGGLETMISFIKRNSLDDTVNITKASGVGYLRPFASTINISNDSGDIADNTTYWNINVPTNSIYTSVNVTNHGSMPSYYDAILGKTTYLDASGNSDSAFRITLHPALTILPLVTSDSINVEGYAIDQQGRFDSVHFASQRIEFSNLPAGNGAYYLLIDANKKAIKKAYIPSVTATLDFPSTATQTNSDLTVTVTGAAIGDFVQVGLPLTAVEDNSSYSAWVSAANTVTVRFLNAGVASQNPSSGSFRVLVTPQ